MYNNKNKNNQKKNCISRITQIKKGTTIIEIITKIT